MSTLYAKPWFMDRPTLERTRDIARVLTGHGLGTILQQSGLVRFAPRARAARERLGARGRRLGDLSGACSRPLRR